MPISELWLHTFAVPGQVAATARWAEQAGFAGLLVADSQSLTADVWVELALAGAATSTLRLGPGATNPRTRALTVTASAAATLHAETSGRAVLGLARGDSALRAAGLEPPSVSEFESDLERLQRLLSGELAWLRASAASKVPVHVAASGPCVIAAAARCAEGIDLTLGADPEVLRRAIERIPEPVSIGAYVNVGVENDRSRARDLVRGSVATFLRFRKRSDLYDPASHGAAASAYSRSLDDELIDRYAVIGSPDEVAERLTAIADAGVDRIIAVPCSLDTDPRAVARSNELLAGRLSAWAAS